MGLTTFEVVCGACGEARWPRLEARPERYVCVRCRSGAGASRREAGKRTARAKKSCPSARQAAGGAV